MKFQVIENKEHLVVPTFNSIPIGTCFRWTKNGPYLNLKVDNESFVELMNKGKAGNFRVTTATPSNCVWTRSDVFVVDATLVIKE